MAKKVLDSDNAVLKNGLLRLATADGPMRLSGAGDHPAVFDDTDAEQKKAATAAKKYVATTGAKNKAPATLSMAGFDFLLESLAESAGPIARRIAEKLPVAERIAFAQSVVERAPITTADLLPLLDEAVAQEKVEREAEAARQERRLAAEAASLAAMEKWKATLTARREAEVAALKRQLAALGAKADEPLPKRDGPGPVTKDDYLFRRDVADQLASSWEATWSPDRPDIREYLESAMWNVRGLRTIGEAGEETAFDGVRHAAVPGVFPGDPIRVVRPGWALEEGEDAEHVVIKATIEKQGA